MPFFDIFLAGGPIMYPLLLISLAAVTFAVERFLAFQQFGGGDSSVLTKDVLKMAKKGQFNEALTLLQKSSGPVSACLTTIIRNRRHPVEDLQREANVTGEDYFLRLERFLPALDTFTTLSPLLGLLGTILGMVKVFQQFTSANDEASKGQILAGVGESLYATAFGISIAVFCFAIYNYFSARQRAISIQTEQASSQLIGALKGSDAEGNTLDIEGATSQAGVPPPAAGAKPDTEPTYHSTRTGFGAGRQLKKTKVEIIPMIDTMFFLLVFFILSSVGIIKLNSLPVTLPTAINGDAQKPAQITISVNATKQVKINSIDLQPGEDIGPRLKQEAERQVGADPKALENASVVVSVDRAVPNGFVVGIINQARLLGISKFSIATDRQPGAGQPAPGTPASSGGNL